MGIPRDAQTDFNRRMRRCEAGWRDTGDPAAVIEALTHVSHFRQVIPDWLAKAALVLINKAAQSGYCRLWGAHEND